MRTITGYPQNLTYPSWWIMSWIKLITCSCRDTLIGSRSTINPFSPANSYLKRLCRWNKKQGKILFCQKIRHGWCPTSKEATLSCFSMKISINLQTCFITIGKIEGKRLNFPSYDYSGDQILRNLTICTHLNPDRRRKEIYEETTGSLKTK